MQEGRRGRSSSFLEPVSSCRRSSRSAVPGTIGRVLSPRQDIAERAQGTQRLDVLDVVVGVPLE